MNPQIFRATVAQEFERKFELLVRTARQCEPAGWDRLVRAARLEAVQREETCTASIDPSEELIFSDGSKIRVANPTQAVYCGWVAVMPS